MDEADALDAGTVEADVVVVGAGPTGLLLAAELGLLGMRTIVLERQPALRDIPKAGGLSGQVLDLLRHRGVLSRFEAASPGPVPVPAVVPWGGLHASFAHLDDPPPLRMLSLPQPLLERELDALARERGADVRRGHPVAELRQDGDRVTAIVRRPDGDRGFTAHYLVGCDGGRSRVRDLTGIAFPGITYPEVHRLATVAMPDSVVVLDGGDLDVDGVGRIPFGFQRTERGEFAVASTAPGTLTIYTSVDESVEYDDDEPMTVDELRSSVRRVLGVDLPMGEPTRLSRFTFHARLVERYRDRRVFLAGDAAHLLAAPGAQLNLGMLDAVNLAWKLAAAVEGWAPAGLLDTYDAERRLAGQRALLQTQAQVALRRGHDAAADALRQVFQELLLDEQAIRRVGAFVAGTDVRYPLPGHERDALTGAFVPDVVGDALHAARPVLLDLAGRAELVDVASGWLGRVDVRTAPASERPADALLIRPDAVVAWAAPVGEAAGTAAAALGNALAHWFGV